MELFSENNDELNGELYDQKLANNLVPICSETILKNLIRKSDHNSFRNETNFNSLRQDYLMLKKLLFNQNNDIDLRAKYQKSLNDINFSIGQKDIIGLQKELTKLKKMLMIMDFEDLIDIMAKTKTAEEKIKNMEVVLLVGKTGSGKSTTLHCLAGSKFRYNDQTDHYEPFDIEPNLINVRTSNSSNSETRFILPIDINLERSGLTGHITICDTPGFNDSAGAEVDIANTFGIVKAIKCCKSVRLVVLISKKSLGDRYDGIIEIAELLSQMITNIADHLDSIIYIFTKFTSNEEIERCITEALKRDGLSDTIKEILIKMKEQRPILIDPLNPKSSNDVLRKIKRMNKIDYPNEIQPLTNSKAFSSLNEQINFHERSINFALEIRNFDLIMFKLGQLKRLNFYLENKNLETTIVRIVEQLKKFFDDIYLKGWNCVTNWSTEDLNAFEQSEVKESIELFKLTKVNILISEYLREEQNYAENLQNLIYTKCESLFDKIKKCSFDEKDDQTAYHCLKKLNILFLNFKWKTIEELLKNSWQQVNCKIMENTQTVSKMLEEKNFDFEKIANILNKCKNIQNINEKIKTIDESNTIHTSISTDCDKALLVVKDYFWREKESILRNLNIKERADMEIIDLFKNAISNLKAATNCSKLCILLDKSDLSEILNILNDKASEKLKNSAYVIFTIIESRELSNQNMNRIKLCLEEMELWLKASDFRTEDHELFNQTRIKLIDFFVTKNSELLGGSLEYFFNNGEEDVNFAKVMRYFEIMRSADWLDRIKEKFYYEIFQKFKNSLFEKLKSFENEYKSYTLNIYSFSSIANINKLIKSIMRYEPLGDIYIDIKDLIKNINEDYRQKLDKVLDEIKKSLNPDSDLNCDMELSLQFLGELISNRLDKQVTTEFENRKRGINDLVRKKFENARSKFENSFSDLQGANFAENSEDILREKCNVMLELFKKFHRIKREFPTIYNQAKDDEYPDDILETWKSNLLSLYSELSEKTDILCLNQHERELEKIILICKSLSSFDRYLNTDNENRFINLCTKFKSKSSNEIMQLKDNIIKWIETKKFTQIKNELSNLNSFQVNKRILDEIRSAISSEVEEIIDDIELLERRINRELNYEDFENLLKKVIVLDQAYRSLYKNISTDASNSNFDRVIDREVAQKICDTFESIKEKISSKLNDFLKKLEDAIRLNSFNQAESLREKFVRIKDLYLHRIFYDDSISKRFSTIEESLENHAVELITRFENIGLNEINFIELKIVFEELDKIKDKMIGYKNAYNKLSNHIIFKIKQYLQNDEGSVSLEKRISLVESWTFYFTKSINEQIKLELNNKKEELKVFKDNYENSLKEFMEMDDVKSICELLNQDFEPKCNLLESKRREINNFFFTKIDQINSFLKENNVEEAFVKLIEIKEYFKHSKNEVIESIEERFYKKLCQLKEIFTPKYEDNDENYFQHFTNINICEFKSLFLFNSYLNDTSLKNIFRNDSKRDETKMLIERIEQLFEKNFQNLSKSLEVLDFDQIFISLKFSDGCSKILGYEQIAAQITSIQESINSNKKIKSLILNRLKMTCENLSEINLLNQRETRLEKERHLFFSRIKKEFMFVKKASESSEFRKMMNTDFSITENFKNIEEIFNKKIKDIEKKALDIIKEETLSENDCNNLRLYCENIFFIDKNLSECLSRNINLNDFSEEFLKNCDEIAQKIYYRNSTIETCVNSLLNLKQISDNVTWLKEKIDSKIAEGITKFKTQNGGEKFLNLATHLSEYEAGLFILGEFDIFKGEMIRVTKEKTNRHDIEYVLKEMEGDDLEIEMLKSRFDKFKEEYNRLIKANLFSNNQNVIIDRLVSKTINLISSSQKFNNGIIKQIPFLVAHIFAVWTLKNISYYKEMEGVSNQESYLLQPHPAQVIAIFRLLGIGFTPGPIKKYTKISWFEQLPKNLVQVNTGEGKSVILAVTAIVLALAGFDVSCACYSEYLSQRDYEEFKEMFELFGLQRQIFYGTFNKVCERLINKNFDLREKVVDMIKLNTEDEIENSSLVEDKERKQVLLIDEVDVFFNEDFLGNFYIPLATLKHQSISQLLKIIWQERHQIDLEKLEEKDEFKECQRVFSNWMDLLNECFKDVLADLKTFESHQYKVTNDKISYMEHGEFKTNIVQGYRTLFAYFNEHERGNISSDSLNDYLGLGIQCGKFSFSEIPKQFNFIFGVSGTLQNLSQSQIDAIKKLYDISKFTYIPSIYGKRKLEFRSESDTIVAAKEDYFIRIKDELDKRMNGTVNPEVKRAILIFFEKFETLSDFYKSPQMEGYVLDDKVNILNEDVSINERKYLIKKATTNGKITLLTRSFGRGIDFICNNKSILTNGGVHVIQTFFSDDPSEEIQIKGRTARQGESGSYSMVLNQEDLEKFFGTSYKTDLDSLTNNNSVYKTTDQRRKEFFNINTQAIQKSIDQALSDHEQSKEFQENLRQSKLNLVKSFLIKQNLGATMTKSRSKTMVLMDATGSMGHLLNQVKNTICTMFDRAIEILNEHEISSDSFEIQLAVYRDYDSLENVLQTSEWERKPLNLRNFMNNIEANGGVDYPEAIEIGLWHVNQEIKRFNSEDRLSQVILIGDAPAKSIDSVKDYRKKYGGETFWSKTKFNVPTFYIDELNLLKEYEVPVHTFYVRTGPEDCFSKIAELTGGQTGFLDVNSSDGSDKLIDLITPLILGNIETIYGKSGNELVKAYTSKYVKSYT